MTLRDAITKSLATAAATIVFLGGAGAASAETPPFEPGPVIGMPEPEPDPTPDLPIDLPHEDPEPDPQPDPLPDEDLPIEQPAPEPDPDPDPVPEDLPFELPQDEPDPDPGPIDPDLPLTNPEPTGDPDPGDPTGEQGEPEDGEVEVEGTQQNREALPRTGAGLVAIAGAGGGLTALGAALRRFARR